MNLIQATNILVAFVPSLHSHTKQQINPMYVTGGSMLGVASYHLFTSTFYLTHFVNGCVQYVVDRTQSHTLQILWFYQVLKIILSLYLILEYYHQTQINLNLPSKTTIENYKTCQRTIEGN